MKKKYLLAIALLTMASSNSPTVRAQPTQEQVEYARAVLTVFPPEPSIQDAVEEVYFRWANLVLAAQPR